MSAETPTNTPSSTPPEYQHFACYRTKALGWQDAGYIVVTSEALSKDDLPTENDNSDLWGNTAWTLDKDHNYQISHTYPELVATPAQEPPKEPTASSIKAPTKD